ncbi:IspD/TarI family cytidylyltransferase [Oribacterium sp. FC2011]|uniref:IspD/TarI family cytidylyltransferase n=1 Tax=Oribacterium sp. FC2011 TaxID=1408311 RepID=UPI0004E0E999|nr:IspD/TarI family cytidylyltransferase [Oribacterium sp. FC2011]
MRAILLSGGTGTRLGGDIPKQYFKVNDRMIIEYSIETLAGCKDIESLVIVADEKWQEAITTALKEYDDRHVFSGFAAPGETRQWSIYNGLLALKGQAGEEDSVLIHDAARPKLKETLIKNMGNALKGYDGVLPVLPMKDTVYKVDGTGKISALLERKEIMAGQAPELFLYGKYLKANEQMIEDGRMGSINGSTEPAFLAGMDIVTIPGDEDNYKITTVRDLERFRTEC